MRALLGRILAGIATLVLVPIEMIVNGVRVVMSVLMPAKNTAADDEALAVIEEEDRTSDAMREWHKARENRINQQPSECDKIRSAAGHRRMTGSFSPTLFDMDKPAEAEIAVWLMSLTEAEALVLSKSDDDAIKAHLDGTTKLHHVRLLPPMQELADELKAASEPLTVLEWIRELMRRAAETGDEPDGDMIDALVEKAHELADRGARLEDYPAETPAPLLDVNDDREDA